jgi:hypothetical protein
LIFSTKSARQVDAARVLRSFGADKVMMLDGGGSAQLLCDGKDYVQSDRPVPQAIAVFAGSGQQLAASTELDTQIPHSLEADVELSPPVPVSQAEVHPTGSPVAAAQGEPALFFPVIETSQPQQQRLAKANQHNLIKLDPRAGALVQSSPEMRGDFRTLLCIPLVMAPVALVLLLAIRKIHQQGI